ncbi:MAG: AAA-like domain-containing protein, partial [Chroococcidiopsis sp.]
MLQIANSAMFAHNGRRLSEVEAALLLGSIQRQPYEQIAEASGYAVSYLKHDVGPKFWKLLGQALGEPVSKTNFRGAL